MKSRIFNIMQYAQHPVTGETLLTEDTIKIALSHKSLREWAYIAHTEDVYSVDDEEQDYNYVCSFYHCIDTEKEYGYLTQIRGAKEDRKILSIKEYTQKYQMKYANQKKPKHWHIVVRSERAIEVDVIARWFGIASQFVECPKGQGAFLDCIEYLVHEGNKALEQGKYHYEDSFVCANFDFRSALTDMMVKRSKFGKDISDKDNIRYKVLYEGLTLSELCSTTQGRLAYQEDYSTLDKLRMKYIQQYAPMPSIRINYSICGKGGDGKNLMCRALARGIAGSLGMNIENEEDIYFEVGANKATFDGYDGQPVIIWNDFRAGELLSVLGGRGNVFKIFDMYPNGRGRQNIKYGSITLINSVNIVNSVQDYHEFLDGLAGDYKREDGTEVFLAEDKGQSYRRFPFVIPIREEDFDLLMNKGVFDGTREYTQYKALMAIRGSMKRIAEVYSGDIVTRHMLEDKAIVPVMEKHQELIELKSKAKSNEDVLSEFNNYGKTEEQIHLEEQYRWIEEQKRLIEEDEKREEIKVMVDVMDDVMEYRTAKYIAQSMISIGKSNEEIKIETMLNDEQIDMLRNGIDYEVVEKFEKWKKSKQARRTFTTECRGFEAEAKFLVTDFKENE